jgi:hypothetical protein
LLVAVIALGVSAWQTFLQNRLMKAQILRDRFEMYWQLYEPVTDAHVENLRLYPQDYMPLDMYKAKYETNEPSLRRYICMSRLYEYLAFTYSLHHVLKVPDPLGPNWTQKWTDTLAVVPEFRDVHVAYHDYYPKFETCVNNCYKAEVPREPAAV